MTMWPQLFRFTSFSANYRYYGPLPMPQEKIDNYDSFLTDPSGVTVFFHKIRIETVYGDC